MHLWEWFRSQFVDNTFSTVFAVAVTWFYARQQIWRLKRQLRTIQQQRQASEVVLILSCRDSIRQAVINQLPGSLSSAQVYEVHRDGDLSPHEEDWMDFVHKIKDKVKEIRESGATRVYLYTSIPVVMGVFAGALLDNGPEVIVNHYFNGTYQQVGRLSHESVYSIMAQ